MMLVDHDVEAELVGQAPFVIVAVQEIGGDGGVLPGVRQIDPQRAGVIRPRRKVGLLGELIDSHAAISTAN
jgi:hypothetical protein